LTQHSLLTAERWSKFDLGNQLLQIGAEMHRATRFVRTGRLDYARSGYERVLRLVDLTVEVQTGSSLRRELLRWREFVAELYLSEAPSPQEHCLALKTLLQLHPTTAAQIASLTT
jgi:hypothetical protein